MKAKILGCREPANVSTDFTDWHGLREKASTDFTD